MNVFECYYNSLVFDGGGVDEPLLASAQNHRLLRPPVVRVTVDVVLDVQNVLLQHLDDALVSIFQHKQSEKIRPRLLRVAAVFVNQRPLQVRLCLSLS